MILLLRGQLHKLFCDTKQFMSPIRSELLSEPHNSWIIRKAIGPVLSPAPETATLLRILLPSGILIG
jgi:hypothetical protein